MGEKDPYFIKNNSGKYECRLCLTLHSNEGSYLAHSQGKRHQTHLAKRAAKEIVEKPLQADLEKPVDNQKLPRVGRPGYRVTKQFDMGTNQRSLLFQMYYPEIDNDSRPHFRLMSTFEQRKEPTDRRYQFVLFAADDYEVVAFKVPSDEIISPHLLTEQSAVESTMPEQNVFALWDLSTKIFSVQISFKNTNREEKCTIRVES